MKHKLKKWHIALMSFMALFIAVFASLFSLRADTVDEETGEVLTDNWELNTVFYDSTVDNGKTPLTEINWDASDGGCDFGQERVITMQINYKNSSAISTYQANELQLSVPNLLYTNNYRECYNPLSEAYEYVYTDSQLMTSITIGANDLTHTGYDWNLKTESIYYSNTFVFTNANTIEEKTNFEGSIQIIYKILPFTENAKISSPNGNYSSIYSPEYENECIHSHNIKIKATIQNIIESNTISFNYTRTYSHPWEYKGYNIEKIALKISSYDGLGDNPQDYIWVKYRFTGVYSSTPNYPYMSVSESTMLIYDNIPDECLVIDKNGNILSKNDGVYQFNIKDHRDSNYSGACIFYVGYPKAIYNEENNNLIITNQGELYGCYYNNLETPVKLAEADVTINLSDFEFEYTGNLYNLEKKLNSPSTYKEMRYQAIINNWKESDDWFENNNISNWKLCPTTIYTGTPITVKIGDDILYALDNNYKYVKVKDNEYCFRSIQIFCLKNGNGNYILENKYDCELWVRYADSTDYVLYEEFRNGYGGDKTTYHPEGNGIWRFSEDEKIVGFYFIIHDLTESIITQSNASYIDVCTQFFKKDIPETGSLYNFGFIQVYQKDENNNLILQNEPSIDSYANFITKEEIAVNDQNIYGTYLQRATISHSWEYYSPTQPKTYVYAYKNTGAIIQNTEKELFDGTYSIGAYFETDDVPYQEYYKEGYLPSYSITGLKIYDLLPEGIVVNSTENEILNSVKLLAFDYKILNFYDLNFQKLSITDHIKKYANITILENWNNTNRTKIEIDIDLKNAPIYVFESDIFSEKCMIAFDINYIITYDTFFEYGNTYTNYCYLNKSSNDTYTRLRNTILDNGQNDIQSSDIDEDNDTTDYLSYAQASTTITSVVSTHQDVTTYVKTDQSNYSTGIVDTSCNSEYEYKLRVRTGSADITNLIVYTNIEEAQPKRTRWYGEFLGVDTTYAENKGYTVKVWYSPNKTAGTLAEDNSWQVYDEATVDKSNVKSLAFQYLVETDNTTDTSTDAIDPAVLPANSLTYVLIKMKSPADENIKTLARMDCWTQWNALDNYDRPVDFITGINSNVVKVALPNSIKADDLPSISLKFIKEIQGETSDFKNLNLNKADEHIFMIRLTNLSANDDGTYNQVTGLLSSTQGLVITQIPIGTYLLEELGDNYFDFVEFTNNNDPEIIIEGVTFEKTEQGYIITVSEDLAETVEFNIKVTNKTEDERFYEEKHNKENLFLINKTGIDHNVPEE